MGRRLELIEVIAVVVAVIVLAALPCIMFIAERNRRRDEQAEKNAREIIAGIIDEQFTASEKTL